MDFCRLLKNCYSKCPFKKLPQANDFMTLFLIGTGVSFDLTLSAMEAIKSADEVYIETYTNPIELEKIERLGRSSGRKINGISRAEAESSFLVELAASKDVCLLASGDPLTATTHVSLVMEARAKGIPAKIIHNSSVYTAAPGKAGLQIYRFGKTASLVNPRTNYKPMSSLEIIRKNLKNDMHSLVLLDTEPRPMDAKAALEMLAEFENAVVLSRLGEPDEKVSYGSIPQLARVPLGSPPFCVIIPAKLHPMEEEFLATCLVGRRG